MTKRICWMMGVILASLLGSAAMAQQTSQPVTLSDTAAAYKTIGLAAAAAFAVGISILGAAYAVGRIGSAALGAAAEKPELLTRSIVFVALAEGLGVLGFAIAMMLLQKI
jgi:V/A-type H+-transporting ATPase subunit K